MAGDVVRSQDAQYGGDPGLCNPAKLDFRNPGGRSSLSSSAGDMHMQINKSRSDDLSCRIHSFYIEVLGDIDLFGDFDDLPCRN